MSKNGKEYDDNSAGIAASFVAADEKYLETDTIGFHGSAAF